MNHKRKHIMCKDKLKEIIELCLKENPCEIDIRYDEPMSEYTSFKVEEMLIVLYQHMAKGLLLFAPHY